MSDDDLTEIRIGLPLPMDITGTLLKVIGLTWPGAVIKNGDDPRHDRHIVVGIPASQLPMCEQIMQSPAPLSHVKGTKHIVRRKVGPVEFGERDQP